MRDFMNSNRIDIRCGKVGNERKKTKIFIAEGLPGTNKGEMTILEGMLESFKLIGNVEVAMLSDHPEIDEICYKNKVKIIDLKKSLYLKGDLTGFYQKFASVYSMLQHMLFLFLYTSCGLISFRFMRSEIWKEYVESDVIMIGHNGTFGPGGGEGTPLYFFPFYVPLFAKLLGKPVVIYGGSIPKPKKFRILMEFIYKHVLNKIDLITLREEISYQYLIKLGVKNARVFVVPDPAFLLRPVLFNQAKKIMIQEGIQERYMPLIGMTTSPRRDFLAFPDINPESSYDTHIKIIAEVIDDLINRLDAFVIIIPHCIGFGNDDRIMAKDILQMVKNKTRVKVITNEYGPEELKGLLGQFDLFIGERLHSVVNAMSMCVPSIVISNFNDERLGIIKMLDQEKGFYCLNRLDANTLISKIDEIWSEREKIKSDLKSKIELIKEQAMLNGKLLKDLLILESREI